MACVVSWCVCIQRLAVQPFQEAGSGSISPVNWCPQSVPAHQPSGSNTAEAQGVPKHCSLCQRLCLTTNTRLQAVRRTCWLSPDQQSAGGRVHQAANDAYDSRAVSRHHGAGRGDGDKACQHACGEQSRQAQRVASGACYTPVQRLGEPVETLCSKGQPTHSHATCRN